MNIRKLEKKAGQLRLDVLDMVFNSKAGHIGGSFSGMDILVALYYYLMDVGKICVRIRIATVLCSAKAIVPKRSMPCWLIRIFH